MPEAVTCGGAMATTTATATVTATATAATTRLLLEHLEVTAF